MRRKTRGRRDRGERQGLFSNAGFLLWMQHRTVACPHESTTERREKGGGGRRITKQTLLLMFDGSQSPTLHPVLTLVSPPPSPHRHQSRQSKEPRHQSNRWRRRCCRLNHRHPPKSFLIPKFASARRPTLISEQYELLILLSPPIFTIQHKDLGWGAGGGGVGRSLPTDLPMRLLMFH